MSMSQKLTLAYAILVGGACESSLCPPFLNHNHTVFPALLAFRARNFARCLASWPSSIQNSQEIGF
jgi:hypothetical protein